MNTLGRALEALAVEDRVHLRCTRDRAAIALGPGMAEGLSFLPAAEEAGAMAGRQRRRFVEKEELGPAMPGHGLAVIVLVAELADQPALERPALLQERARCRIVDDAAIAHHHAPFRDSDDLAE